MANCASRWLLAAVVLLATASLAEAEPGLVPLQGHLSDSEGEPIDGPHRLTFTLFDSAEGGTARYTDDRPDTIVDDGHFVVYLGDRSDSELDVALFRDHPELWVEVIIDGTEIVQPRTRLAAVPYSAHAQHCGDAQTLSGRPPSDLVPAGALMPFAGASAPPGWLLADGAEVSRTTYAALFAAIGTTYGAGDGSTTFHLPDLRGRAAVGAGQGSGLGQRDLGQTFGSESHTLSVAELPSHSHGGSTGTAGDHAHTTGSAGGHAHTGTTTEGNAMAYRTVGDCGGTGTAADHIRGWSGCNFLDRNDANYALRNHTHNFGTTNNGAHTHTVSSAGNHEHSFTTDGGQGTGGAAHPIAQPSIGLTYLIKH